MKNSVTKATILVASHDYKLRILAKNFIESMGHRVLEASDGEKAIEIFKNNFLDLIILDAEIPKISGFDILLKIRADSRIPVIMLTDSIEKFKDIIGYDIGANQYMIKPIDTKLLIRRVEELLNKSMPQAKPKLDFGDLSIDKISRSVYINGEWICLRDKEYDLLVYLAENQPLTLSREKILENVWRYDYFGEVKDVDDCISILRKKLGKYGKCITAVRMAGYKFDSSKSKGDKK